MKKKKEIEKGDVDMAELLKFANVVGEHDERGLILALAAFAEDSLEGLLLAYLVPGKQAKDLVEGFNAPLGTLSARIKAAYALGLLTREQYEDLDVARRIRNAFAHDWAMCSFSRPDIKSLIGKLHAYEENGRPTDRGVQGRSRLMISLLNILMSIRFLASDIRRGKRHLQLVKLSPNSLLHKPEK